MHKSRQALRASLEVRRKANVKKNLPICVYDFAEKIGVKIRFVGGGSFGGMYSKPTNTILVPSLRPPGRQAFTCAHELGHWYFRHGTRLDDAHSIRFAESQDPKEELANQFASFLLMPSWTVKSAFDSRGWTVARASPTMIFQVAGQLGVGFSTLIHHMQKSLGLLSGRKAKELLTWSPQRIRQQILQGRESSHLIVADTKWNERIPIDLRIGDLAIIPARSCVDGPSAVAVGSVSQGLVIEARKAGISRVVSPAWTVFLRVRPTQFTGRAIYRHLEDPDVDIAS